MPRPPKRKRVGRRVIRYLACCSVPSCHSSQSNCPDKKFFPIPSDPNIRRIWLRRANIDFYVSTNLPTFFCEDHFENDTMLCPSKFECQYFMEFDMSYPAPPLQKLHPLDEQKKKRRYQRTPICVPKPESKKLLTFEIDKQKNNELKPEPHNFSECRDTPIKFNSIACVIKMEHDYAKECIYISKADSEKNSLAKCMKDNHRTKIKLNDNFLRINKNNLIYAEVKLNRDLNENTDSADSIYTFKCDHCGIEYIHSNDLEEHFKEKHINKEQEQELLSINELNSVENTNRANSIPKLWQTEYVHNTDLLGDISKDLDIEDALRVDLNYDHRRHLEDFNEPIRHDLDNFEEEPSQYYQDEDEPLDIKPEIYQCSKCPSSFINEEDTSKHLQIMHGDLINFTNYIKKAKNNKICDKSESPNDEQCIEITQEERQQRSECEVNFSGYNFAEIETSVEIKRETVDTLEDIDFSMDNQNFDEPNLGFDPMYYLDSYFNESHCDTNINSYKDIQTEHTELNAEEMNLEETRNIRDHLECQITKNSNNVATFQCSYQDFLSQMYPSQDSTMSENTIKIVCKKCSTAFPNQEALLNHLHELINTKARLYSDAKRVLKADSVRFKSHETMSRSGDKQYLNDAELLDYIHRVFIKNGKQNMCLQVIKYTNEEDDVTVNPIVDLKICRCCSTPLPRTTIQCKRKDKICRSCKRIEVMKDKQRKSARAKLYASAKNVQLKNCTDPEKDCDKALASMLSHKQTKLSALNEMLASVGKVFNEPKDKNIETDEDSSPFQENDLLKPIREEDEKVLVQPYDPTLCKSCLIPLNVGRTTKSTVCQKCKNSEATNEKRRKSKEKKISTKNMKLPYVLLHKLPDKYNGKKCSTSKKNKKSIECNICHLKFSNRLDLREHVVRSHL